MGEGVLFISALTFLLFLSVPCLFWKNGSKRSGKIEWKSPLFLVAVDDSHQFITANRAGVGLGPAEAEQPEESGQ